MEEKRYPRALLATACVPWNEDETLDGAHFSALVRALRAKELSHIYIFGTAGEGHAVSREQFTAVTELFAREMAGACPCVGVISLSAVEARERIKIAYALGVRDFQISLPSWGALTEEEIFAFFHYICDPFPDCRFMHYNCPRAKVMVTPKQYARLCAELLNLAAVKFITSDMSVISALMAENLPLRVFLTEPGFATGALIEFDCGFLISVAACNIEQSFRFLKAAKACDKKELLRIWGELSGILREFSQAVPAGRIDSAYDKLLCRFLVPDFPQRLLPPYNGFPDADARFLAFKAAIIKNFPAWADEK